MICLYHYDFPPRSRERRGGYISAVARSLETGSSSCNKHQYVIDMIYTSFHYVLTMINIFLKFVGLSRTRGRCD